MTANRPGHGTEIEIETEGETNTAVETDAGTGTPRDPEGDDVRQEHVGTDPFIALLTPGARLRILRALMLVRGEKLNVSHICKSAGIHHDTWYQHRDDLLAYGVIEEAAPAGNSPMYRVDMDHPITKRLWEVRSLAAEHYQPPQ